MRFTTEPMSEIITTLQARLTVERCIAFEILDPDLFAGAYAGTRVEVEGISYLHRSLRAWMDLAEVLGCRMLTPKPSAYPLIRITYQKLDNKGSFHDTHTSDKAEKYGIGSDFFGIHKMEEPAFYHYFRQALQQAYLPKRRRVLDLGINRGDEFDSILKMIDTKQYQDMELIGIDHSESAITYAKERFGAYPNISMIHADLNGLDDLELGCFDLLISIGTLQSPGINYKPLLMHLVQNYLSNDAALILGFPNSRWIDGEMLYGAKAAHYRFPEMGVVLEDILFAKRYLQQKKFRVRIIGKQYLFLVATKISTAINQTSL